MAEIEVSVVIPCLDEAETIAHCITRARDAMAAAGLQGEIVVADNGSSDGSEDLAKQAGALVIQVPRRGYGSALMAGIAAARGEYIVMGDADASYDFAETPRLVARLREGFDLVQGCRLPSGGGRVASGAMPWLHRWFGNPFFSLLARLWFAVPVHDVYCGLRAFRREFQQRLGQRCLGMEFAIEMILRAVAFGGRLAEIPITLSLDGRRDRRPHLRTFRDGWRTLRLLLLFSPVRVFLLPGLVLTFMGLIGYALALPGIRIGGVTFDAHTLLVSSLALLVGIESVLFYGIASAFAVNEGMLSPDERFRRVLAGLQLERGLLAGALCALSGAALLVLAVNEWRLATFGALDYAHTMRMVIPGSTLVALGVQLAHASFLVSLLAMERR